MGLSLIFTRHEPLVRLNMISSLMLTMESWESDLTSI